MGGGLGKRCGILCFEVKHMFLTFDLRRTAVLPKSFFKADMISRLDYSILIMHISIINDLNIYIRVYPFNSIYPVPENVSKLKIIKSNYK